MTTEAQGFKASLGNRVNPLKRKLKNSEERGRGEVKWKNFKCPLELRQPIGKLRCGAPAWRCHIHAGTNIKEKKMSAKGKGSALITLNFPTWPHIPAQEVNRREQGPQRSGEWVTGFSCTSPNKNKRTLPKPLSLRLLELSSPESTWLSCHKDPTFGFYCLPHSICPTKDPPKQLCAFLSWNTITENQTNLRLNQDSLQRSPWAWPTLLSWLGLAIKLASNDPPTSASSEIHHHAGAHAQLSPTQTSQHWSRGPLWCRNYSQVLQMWKRHFLDIRVT